MTCRPDSRNDAAGRSESSSAVKVDQLADRLRERMIGSGRYLPDAEPLLRWLAGSLLRWQAGLADLASASDDDGDLRRRVALERILARRAGGAFGLISAERVKLAAVDEAGADTELSALLEI